MPQRNYCKKCKREVPSGSQCALCGAKLTKAGERLSFGITQRPVEDWFCWNAVLRLIVPVIALVWLTTVLIEAAVEGANGVQAVFVQGFFWTMLCVLGLGLLATLVMLLLQGRREILYALDGKGAHATVCLRDAGTVQLGAHLMTRQSAEALRQSLPEELETTFTPVRHADLAWTNVARAQFWPEKHTVLLYQPIWWQAMAIQCPANEYEAAVEYVKHKVCKKKRTASRRKM